MLLYSPYSTQRARQIAADVAGVLAVVAVVIITQTAGWIVALSLLTLTALVWVWPRVRFVLRRLGVASDLLP